ncbi:MAG TPA: DapH/DapD/GlmU-related protein [Bacteroidales bacterium]|nr:DapH/DapD/GlmU-related protein [Bacteroidales bacterium]
MSIPTRLHACLRRFYYKRLSGGYKQLKGKPILNQPIMIKGYGALYVGEKVQIGYESSASFWSTYAYFDLRGKGFIRIGDRVIINNNAALTADDASIEIGKDTVIGINFTVMTSNGHALDSAHRHDGTHPCLPVQIGENVFIGDNVTILKGVKIGRNAVIGANSLVIKDIPDNAVATGNPCRVLRLL